MLERSQLWNELESPAHSLHFLNYKEKSTVNGMQSQMRKRKISVPNQLNRETDRQTDFGNNFSWAWAWETAHPCRDLVQSRLRTSEVIEDKLEKDVERSQKDILLTGKLCSVSADGGTKGYRNHNHFQVTPKLGHMQNCLQFLVHWVLKI